MGFSRGRPVGLTVGAALAVAQLGMAAGGASLGCASIGDAACVDCATPDGGVVPAPVAPDAAASPDAEPPLGAFGAPVPLAELNDPAANDEDPSATGDLLELYFDSDRAGGAGGRDIWVARRASVDDPFGAAEPVLELNTAGQDSDPEVSADGLTLHLTSDRAGGQGGLDLWVATRASRDAAWSAPVVVTELNSTSRDVAAAMAEDQRLIVFHSARAGSNDLFLATRAEPGGTWSEPQRIEAVDADDTYEGNGSLSGDGLVLIFASDRPGGAGEDDLYMATRASRDDAFGAPVRLEELCGAGRDADPHLALDQRTLFFATTRDGTNDLYLATR